MMYVYTSKQMVGTLQNCKGTQGYLAVQVQRVVYNSPHNECDQNSTTN